MTESFRDRLNGLVREEQENKKQEEKRRKERAAEKKRKDKEWEMKTRLDVKYGKEIIIPKLKSVVDSLSPKYFLVQLKHSNALGLGYEKYRGKIKGPYEHYTKVDDWRTDWLYYGYYLRWYYNHEEIRGGSRVGEGPGDFIYTSEYHTTVHEKERIGIWAVIGKGGSSFWSRDLNTDILNNPIKIRLNTMNVGMDVGIYDPNNISELKQNIQDKLIERFV